MANRYYFAYGSNLNIEQVGRRCPGIRAVCKLRLYGYKLEFRGVANVIPAKDTDFVDGAVYEITKDHELALDRYEGCDHRDPTSKAGMYRQVTFEAKIGGAIAEVMMYVMNGGSVRRPLPHYYDCIKAGFRDWHLSSDSLLDALRRSEQAGTDFLRANNARRAAERARHASADETPRDRPRKRVTDLNEVWNGAKTAHEQQRETDSQTELRSVARLKK